MLGSLKRWPHEVLPRLQSGVTSPDCEERLHRLLPVQKPLQEQGEHCCIKSIGAVCGFCRRTVGGEGGETVNAVPQLENDLVSQRIDRAYRHMLAAKSSDWAHAWGDCFVVLVRQRNAQRSRAEVLEMERARGLR